MERADHVGVFTATRLPCSKKGERKMKKHTVILALALIAAFSSIAAAADIKIGIVNLQKALNDCSAGK